MKPEALKNKASSKAHQPLAEYQSNPFSLSFNKFGLFFEKNLGWAIALLVIPVFFGLLQFGSQIPWLLEPDTTETTSTTTKKEDTTYKNNYYSGDKEEKTPDFTQYSEDEIPPLGAIAVIVSILVVLFVGIVILQALIQTFIFGMLTYVALENDAGRKASLRGSIDAVVSRFRRLFLAQLLASAKIFGWTLLLIIPGIIATFRYALLPFVIMDESPKNKGVVASHDRVKEIVAGRKREVFGVATVAVIIPIIGTIIQFVGNAALYRQLQSYHDQNGQKAPVHWLNYFGFMLIGIYLLFIIALVALLIAFAETS